MFMKRIEIQIQHGRLVPRDERRPGLVLADVFMLDHRKRAAAALQRDGEEGRVGLDVLLLARDRGQPEALVRLVDLRRLDVDVAVLRRADEARHGCAAAGVLRSSLACWILRRLACWRSLWLLLDFARRAMRCSRQARLGWLRLLRPRTELRSHCSLRCCQI